MQGSASTMRRVYFFSAKWMSGCIARGHENCALVNVIPSCHSDLARTIDFVPELGRKQCKARLPLCVGSTFSAPNGCLGCSALRHEKALLSKKSGLSFSVISTAWQCTLMTSNRLAGAQHLFTGTERRAKLLMCRKYSIDLPSAKTFRLSPSTEPRCGLPVARPFVSHPSAAG